MSNNHHDIVRLNVGGQHFVTTRATLCAEDGSLLAHMFRSDSQFASPKEISSSIGDDDHDHDDNSKSSNNNGGGEVFLDRDPFVFGTILNYLRDGCRVVVDLSNKKEILQRLRTDADYYSLEGLILYCDTKLNDMAVAVAVAMAVAEEEKDSAARRAEKEKQMKNTMYRYCRRDECISPGPGWKLVKVTPRLHNFYRRDGECGCRVRRDYGDCECEYGELEKWKESFVFEKEQQQGQQEPTTGDNDTATAATKETPWKVYKYAHFRFNKYHDDCQSPDGPGWKLWQNQIIPPLFHKDYKNERVWDEGFIFERITTMAEEEEEEWEEESTAASY